jgi:hypothetical protein
MDHPKDKDGDVINHTRKVANLEHRIDAFRDYANEHGKQLYVLNLTSTLTDWAELKDAYVSFKRSLTTGKKSPFQGSWLGVIESNNAGMLHLHGLLIFDRDPTRKELDDFKNFASEKWRMASFRKGSEVNHQAFQLEKPQDSHGRRFSNYMAKLVDYKNPRRLLCAKPKLKNVPYTVKWNLPDEVKEEFKVENLPSYSMSAKRIMNEFLKAQGLSSYMLERAWRN